VGPLAPRPRKLEPPYNPRLGTSCATSRTSWASSTRLVLKVIGRPARSRSPISSFVLRVLLGKPLAACVFCYPESDRFFRPPFVRLSSAFRPPIVRPSSAHRPQFSTRSETGRSLDHLTIRALPSRNSAERHEPPPEHSTTIRPRANSVIFAVLVLGCSAILVFLGGLSVYDGVEIHTGTDTASRRRCCRSARRASPFGAVALACAAWRPKIRRTGPPANS